MSLIGDLILLRPTWLLAVLVLIPLLWLLLRSTAPQRAWAQACDSHLLPHLMINTGFRTRRWPLLLFCLAWIVACVALAGPAWERKPLPVVASSAARVLVVDLSQSMWANDLSPSRIARTRMKLQDLLDQLSGGQTGLVVFSDDAYIVSPLTEDVNTLRGQIEVLDPGLMPAEGYQPQHGLELAVELLQRGGHASGDVLMLLSGEVGSVLREKAVQAGNQGYRVSVWMTATDVGGPVALPQGGFLSRDDGQIRVLQPDSAGMRALAASAGGVYSRLAVNDADIDAFTRQFAAVAGNDATADTDSEYLSEAWQDRGPWLILLLVPLAALAFRRGWLLALPLVVIALPQPALAFEWRDLFQRPDQRAAQALEEGDFEKARSLASDPDLAAAAAYRDQDFDAAAQNWAQGDTAREHYNRGNALARQGEFESALDAYDQALAEDSEFEDAIANKQAVQQWLEQQPPPESEQQGEDGDESDEQSDDSESGSDEQSGEQDQQNESEQQQSDQQSDQSERQSEQTDSDQQQDDSGESQDSADAEAGETLSEDEASSAQQQLREELDQALAEEGEAASAVESQQPYDEQRDALEQWLRRVPDDPGGLLRAKFRLEQQRRAAEARDGRRRQ